MPKPRALLIVRNPFVHDARVLRAAETVRDRGLEPRVLAVMSTEVRRRHDVARGVPVLRLDPQSPIGRLRRALRRGRAAAPATAAAAAPPVRRLDDAPLGRLGLRLHRGLRTVDFYRRALGVVRRERPALLHCNDYNTMWIGTLTRAVSPRTAVLYDSHELWPDRNLRPEPRWWLLLCEALFVRAADVVVTASPGYSDVMARRYRIPRPAVVLNVPPRGDSEPVEAAPAAEPDVAVYAGGLLPHRGLETAVEMLALVPALRLRLVGPGRPGYVERLRDHARAHGVADRLEVLGPVDPAAVVDALRGAAFGLALFQPVCLSHRLVAPNKLFEYVAAALPTLASDLPVMRAFVDEWRVGLTVSPADVEEVAAAARSLLEPETNLALRRRAAAAAAEVTWERERDVLAGAYDDALAAARHR
jgi:glycosyltransferase involved in cell wall biosynthesis